MATAESPPPELSSTGRTPKPWDKLKRRSRTSSASPTVTENIATNTINALRELDVGGVNSTGVVKVAVGKVSSREGHVVVSAGAVVRGAAAASAPVMVMGGGLEPAVRVNVNVKKKPVLSSALGAGASGGVRMAAKGSSATTATTAAAATTTATTATMRKGGVKKMVIAKPAAGGVGTFHNVIFRLLLLLLLRLLLLRAVKTHLTDDKPVRSTYPIE
jgi:hypothetical protein